MWLVELKPNAGERSRLAPPHVIEEMLDPVPKLEIGQCLVATSFMP